MRKRKPILIPVRPGTPRRPDFILTGFTNEECCPQNQPLLGGLSRNPVLDGFDHGDDIFRRGAGLDTVAGAWDVAPTYTESFQAGGHFPAHIIRRAVRKNVLVFDPSMENHFIAEITLQCIAFHPRADVLNWVEDIDPRFDEVRDEIAGGTIGVEENFLPVGVDQLAPFGQPGLEVLLPGGDRDESAFLRAHTIGDENQIDQASEFAQEAVEHRRLDGIDPVERGIQKFGLRDRIHEGVLHAAHVAVDLEVGNPGADVAKPNARARSAVALAAA